MKDLTKLTIHMLTLTTRMQSQIARVMGPTWAHLGPVGPRWAPCWPHEPCYLGCQCNSTWTSLHWVYINNVYYCLHAWTVNIYAANMKTFLAVAWAMVFGTSCLGHYRLHPWKHAFWPLNLYFPLSCTTSQKQPDDVSFAPLKVYVLYTFVFHWGQNNPSKSPTARYINQNLIELPRNFNSCCTKSGFKAGITHPNPILLEILTKI